MKKYVAIIVLSYFFFHIPTSRANKHTDDEFEEINLNEPTPLSSRTECWVAIHRNSVSLYSDQNISKHSSKPSSRSENKVSFFAKLFSWCLRAPEVD